MKAAKVVILSLGAFALGVGTGFCCYHYFGSYTNSLDAEPNLSRDDASLPKSKQDQLQLDAQQVEDVDAKNIPKPQESEVQRNLESGKENFSKANSRDSSSEPYTDNYVSGIIEQWRDLDPNLEYCLRVVPNGTVAPLATVFGALGIDPAKFGEPEIAGFRHVVVLNWKISPSFYLYAMTDAGHFSDDGEDGDDVGYNDPKRLLYGIRLIPRERN